MSNAYTRLNNVYVSSVLLVIILQENWKFQGILCHLDTGNDGEKKSDSRTDVGSSNMAELAIR